MDRGEGLLGDASDLEAVPSRPAFSFPRSECTPMISLRFSFDMVGLE
jgi:hypothetical protein